MYFVDQQQEITKSQRGSLRERSPTSVKWLPEESAPKKKLASSIKDFFAPSLSSHSTRSTSSDDKRVGFKPWVEAKGTLSRNDMTEDEKANYWIKHEESLLIRRRSRVLVQQCTQASPLSDKNLSKYYTTDFYGCFKNDMVKTKDGNEHSIRGLEAWSKSEKLRKRTNRQQLLRRIFMEQDFQCLRGFRDENAIAEICIKMTSHSRPRALHMAKKDRLVVEQYYHDE